MADLSDPIFNGWFPSGIPWEWYLGSPEGNTGVDGALGWEGGNQVTIQIYINFNDLPVAVGNLLGINSLAPAKGITLTGTTTAANPSIVIAPNTAMLTPGMAVSCTDPALPITPGTTIVSVDDATHITVNFDPVRSGTFSLFFGPPGAQNYSRLFRQAPMPHPLLSHLFCSRIVSAKPLGFVRKAAYPFVNNSGNVNIGVTAVWKYWMLQLLFTQPRWNRTLSDPAFYRLFGANAGEWNRFTTVLYRPSSDAINREVGQNGMSWAETSATGPVVGKPFPSNIFQNLAKADLILIWHRIPKFNGLFSTDTGALYSGLPTNINNCIGRLNNAPFLNFPTGTLRMLPPEIVELENPVPPNLLGVLPVRGQTSIMCDVHIPLSFFDPPAGATTKGHNLEPFAGDNKWYLTTVDGTLTGTGLYPLADITQVFRLPG